MAPSLELKAYEGVFCVNRAEKNEHHRSQGVVKTWKKEPDEVC